MAEATGYVDEEKQRGEMNNGSNKLASFDYEDAEDFFEDFAGDKELAEFDGRLEELEKGWVGRKLVVGLGERGLAMLREESHVGRERFGIAEV